MAALRGKTARKNANPFGGVISAVSDKDRRTVNCQLVIEVTANVRDEGLAAGIKPTLRQLHRKLGKDR